MKYLVQASNHIHSIEENITADSDSEAIYKGITMALYSMSRPTDKEELETSLTFFKVKKGNKRVYEITGETKDILKVILEEI